MIMNQSKKILIKDREVAKLMCGTKNITQKLKQTGESHGKLAL
jgi:hypothetical protein